MAVDERRLHDLYTELEDRLGADHADTLMTLLPPADWNWHDVATKQDLEREIGSVRTELKSDINSLRTELKAEMGELRTELKEDISGLRGQYEGLRGEFIGLRGEFGGLRREVNSELSHGRCHGLDRRVT